MLASSPLDDKHAHDLTRVNLQYCTICKRFFVLSYDKNERGEAVETGHELDLKITKTGIVKLQESERETIDPNRVVKKRRESTEEGCW